jgi:hypothetical protein
MWSGLKLITGGFVLLLLLCVSFSASGQDQSRVQVIAWTLELKQLLTDCYTQISSTEMQTEESENNVSSVITKDDQSSKESEAIYQEQEKTSDQQQKSSSEVSTSLIDCLNTSKAVETERDNWRTVAIVVIIGAAGYIAGDRLGWW